MGMKKAARRNLHLTETLKLPKDVVTFNKVILDATRVGLPPADIAKAYRKKRQASTQVVANELAEIRKARARLAYDFSQSRDDAADDLIPPDTPACEVDVGPRHDMLQLAAPPPKEDPASTKNSRSCSLM